MKIRAIATSASRKNLRVKLKFSFWRLLSNRYSNISRTLCNLQRKMLTKDTVIEKIKSNREQIQRLGVRDIGLFGSYVREEQRADSDIDLLVEFQPEQKTFDHFMELCFLLDEVFEGIKVEVVTAEGLSPYIAPKILNELEYVQIGN